MRSDIKTSDSDNHLLGLAAGGDQAAYGLLLDRHHGPVSSFAFRMLGNRAEAEEIAQETFGRIWTHAGRWKPDGRAKAWIYRIAKNLCIDRLRARRPVVDLDGHEFKDDGPSPEQVLHRKEKHTNLHEAIAALPERQKMAIALFHLQDMTADEAAAAMEITVDALESLLRRGRKKLKDIMSSGEKKGGAIASPGVG